MGAVVKDNGDDASVTPQHGSLHIVGHTKVVDCGSSWEDLSRGVNTIRSGCFER